VTVYGTIFNAMEMAFHWKQYHKWSSGAWLLHSDTGPCHTEFLAKHRMPVLPHLLYSLDFAPMQIPMLPQAIACPKWEAIQDVVVLHMEDAVFSETYVPHSCPQEEGLQESLHTTLRIIC